MKKNLKTFQLRDLSYTKGVNSIISFMIDDKNTLYGTNQNLDFYIGKIDKNFNITLFKAQNTPNPFITIDCFEGKIDLENKTFGGKHWFIPINYEYQIEKIQNISYNKSLHNIIVDENIPNINLMILQAYKSRTEKLKNLEELVEKIRNCNINKKQKVRVKIKQKR